MRMMIVCFALFVGGVLLLPYSVVGSAVSELETASVTGGACYTENANAAKVTVCSQTCGTRMTWPRAGSSSGNSAAGIACGSEPNCTYGGVGSSACSGG